MWIESFHESLNVPIPQLKIVQRRDVTFANKPMSFAKLIECSAPIVGQSLHLRRNAKRGGEQCEQRNETGCEVHVGP